MNVRLSKCRAFSFRSVLRTQFGPFLLLFIFLLGGNLYGQKETTEIIDASNVSRLYIDTDEVFRISIRASKTSEIRITSHSEGEYYDDILLETAVKDGELKVLTRYPENLTGGFDKLSAHKVFSMEIELQVPEGIEVMVTSNIASLIAYGNYHAIYAGLKQGFCQLLEFSGMAKVNTYGGDILVETQSGLIDAKSRHGKVLLPGYLPGRDPIKLTSIDGDITVRKTK